MHSNVAMFSASKTNSNHDSGNGGHDVELAAALTPEWCCETFKEFNMRYNAL